MRGALMVSMDVNHPDILEFIKVKRDLTKVIGANISVKLNDEFMKAVENDEDYILRFPCNIETERVKDILSWTSIEQYNELRKVHGNIYFKRIKAKEYWNEIIKSAHNVAEPGLMFWDNMVNYSPDGVYSQFKQVTTNPCSEIAMQPYDACRLIAVNLFSFVKNPFTDNAEFDLKKFYGINYEAMRLSDDLIDLELEYIDRIINKIKSDPESVEIKNREFTLWNKVKETTQASRRVGLGFTALADTLAALGIKYDSNEALNIVDKIMRVKMGSELDCTIDLAVLRGTFKGWDKNKECEIVNHNETLTRKFGNSWYSFLYQKFPKQAQRMQKWGRRNCSFSTLAPTGSVSILTRTSSGVEPLFKPFYIRRKKITSDKERIDFIDKNGEKWQEYFVLHPKFEDWLNLNNNYNVEDLTKDELESLFKQSPWYNSTANDIDWVKRVEIQGIIQKYITHSISSTINLPNDVTEEEVSTIYLESWKKGLKGITVKYMQHSMVTY